jgi:hypothetical protein
MFRLGVTATGWKWVRQATCVVRKGFWLVGCLGVEPRWMRSLCQKASTIWRNHFCLRASMIGGGGPCPFFNYTLALALQLRNEMLVFWYMSWYRVVARSPRQHRPWRFRCSMSLSSPSVKVVPTLPEGCPFKLASPANPNQGKLNSSIKNIVNVKMPAPRFVTFRMRDTENPLEMSTHCTYWKFWIVLQVNLKNGTLLVEVGLLNDKQAGPMWDFRFSKQQMWRGLLSGM